MAEAVKRASFATEDLKQGGGNLWASNAPVRATVTGGRFTKEAPEGYAAEGNPIFGAVEFLIAGDAPEEERRVNQSFSLGAQAGDNFTLSEDGQYLVPSNDDAAVIKDSKFGIFAISLQQEGVPSTILKSFEFSKLVGLDGDWKRIEDKARNFANDKPNARKSKFPPSTLCLVKLHAMPGEKAVTKTNGAVQSATASTAPAASSGDLDSDTWTALESALKASKGNSLQRGQIVLKVSQQAVGNANRAAIAKQAADEAFLKSLAESGLITYGAAEKGQPVTLAA